MSTHCKPWTEADTAYLLAHYRTRQLQDIAADLGHGRSRVVARFGKLVKAGKASMNLRAHHPQWSEVELRFARERVGRPGWTLALIAEKLGRTETALKLKLRREQVRNPVTGATAQTLSLRDVLRVLGLGGHHRPVWAWVRAGLLKAGRVPSKREATRGYVIYPADLVEFLQLHPERYDYDRIPRLLDGKPNPYREHARRHDPTAGYLTRKQAARALRVNPCTLKRWEQEGRVVSEKRTGAGIHPQEVFLSRREVERVRGLLVQLPNGWYSLPVSLRETR